MFFGIWRYASTQTKVYATSVIHNPAVSQLDDAVSVGGIHLGVRNLNNSRSRFVEPLKSSMISLP